MTMKKFSRLFLVGSLATALFLGYGFAKAENQNQPADNQGGDPAMQEGNHGDLDNGRIERLKDKLGLTDDQAIQLKEAFKKQAEANKPLRDQEKIDIDTLQQKVDQKDSDSDIKTLLDKLEKDHKQMQEVQQNSMDKIRTILNPTQQAKWVLAMRRGPMGRGGWDGKKKDGWKKHKDSDVDAKSAQSDAPATPTGN